jgi:methylthioribose-1-phosphate isomerase
MATAETMIRSVRWKDDHILLLDQQQLPQHTIYIPVSSIEDVWECIYSLKVRGAPAIGITAGFGLALWSNQYSGYNLREFKTKLIEQKTYLTSSRPTAVNLQWAVDRIVSATQLAQTVDQAKEIILNEALRIQQEDEVTCKSIGEYGLSLLHDGAVVMTHCNAGGIATAKYGTALAPFYLAKEKGWDVKVFANETRPVLQGARLTAWELQNAGIDVTLITDNMAAYVMKAKQVDAVIVGADRIAANGDTANKIGTFGLALQAKALDIPFYVASPLSTIDLSTPTGDDIPIEQRNPEEVTHLNGVEIAPKGIQVFNPAFDVTPNNLITAIITERGIVRKNYKANLLSVVRDSPFPTVG